MDIGAVVASNTSAMKNENSIDENNTVMQSSHKKILINSKKTSLILVGKKEIAKINSIGQEKYILKEEMSITIMV